MQYNIILFTPLFSTPRQGSISNPCKPLMLIALPRSRLAPCSIGRRGCLGRRSLGTMDVTVLRSHSKKLLVSSTNHPKYGWETWEKNPQYLNLQPNECWHDLDIAFTYVVSDHLTYHQISYQPSLPIAIWKQPGGVIHPGLTWHIVSWWWFASQKCVIGFGLLAYKIVVHTYIYIYIH